MTDCGSVIDWLLDSDPSVQVGGDARPAGPQESEWRVERAKVET
jgi:hypothetical protein